MYSCVHRLASKSSSISKLEIWTNYMDLRYFLSAGCSKVNDEKEKGILLSASTLFVYCSFLLAGLRSVEEVDCFLFSLSFPFYVFLKPFVPFLSVFCLYFVCIQKLLRSAILFYQITLVKKLQLISVLEIVITGK